MFLPLCRFLYCNAPTHLFLLLDVQETFCTVWKLILLSYQYAKSCAGCHYLSERQSLMRWNAYLPLEWLNQSTPLLGCHPLSRRESQVKYGCVLLTCIIIIRVIIDTFPLAHNGQTAFQSEGLHCLLTHRPCKRSLPGASSWRIPLSDSLHHSWWTVQVLSCTIRPGVQYYMDDVIIHGVDMQTHDAALKATLHRLNAAGLQLN